MSKNLCFLWSATVLLLSAPVSANSSSSTPSFDPTQQALLAKEPGACYFSPPPGWEYIDPSSLPPLVKLMIRGKSSFGLPPSINLAVEPTDLTLEEYIFEAEEAQKLDRRTHWTRLGKMQSRAGEMVLIQIDSQTKVGDVRMVQAILIYDQLAYVLTTSALRKEFPKFCNCFYKSIQSFTINKVTAEP